MFFLIYYIKYIIIYIAREIWCKGKTENSVKAGRLCHLIPVPIVGRGGGYYGKIHTKNYIFNYCVFDSAYKKSKIAPTDQVRAIF